MRNRRPNAGHTPQAPRRIEDVEGVVPSRPAFEVGEYDLTDPAPGRITLQAHVDPTAPREEIERSFGRALTRLLDWRRQMEFDSLVVKVINLRRWPRDPAEREAQARPLARRLARLEKLSPTDSLEKRLLRHSLHWLTRKTRAPSAGDLQRSLERVYGIRVTVRQIKRVLYEAHTDPGGRPFGYADWS